MKNTGTLRVLLIEDDPIAEKIAQLNFREHSVSLNVAKCGREALEIALENVFDVILMDIGLPDMDGYTLTKLIRDVTGHATFIVGLSAHVDEAHRERCFDSGMNQVYAKPLTPVIVKEILTLAQDHIAMLSEII